METKTQSPTPAEVRAAREAANLSQTEAAALIHCTRDAWSKWESGTREMHLAFWELFAVKSANIKSPAE